MLAGLDAIREEFVSWAWRFGKTPRFTVTRSFPIPSIMARQSGAMSAGLDKELAISLDVTKGVIEDVTLKIPPNMMTANG